MPARQKSCCFTGHRPAKLPWGYREEDPRCVTLKARISDAAALSSSGGGLRHGNNGFRELFAQLYAAAGPLYGGPLYAADRRV